MEDQNPEVQNDLIKIGEKEYSQEDLTRLVGLGEIGAESEEKYGVKIDKIWPNHQRTINEKMQLEQRLADIEKVKTETPKTETELSEEQIAQGARDQLTKLGYLSESQVQQKINDALGGYRLLNHAQDVIDKMVDNGYPATNTEDLFEFMKDPSNPKDPEKAYKLMFEEQIDRIKEQKLASLKPSSMPTISSSTAGSKEPAPQKVTSKNLRETLAALLPD